MARAAIALGANLGERLETLTRAVRSLHRPGDGLAVTAISSWYETEPVGPVQPLYINGCLTLQTELAPVSLLGELQQREAAAGRTREVHWGARTLDLDLLWYDDWVQADTVLTLPHPRLEERPFVLVPLAQIAPDWRHPLTDKRVADLGAEVSARGVERVVERAVVATALGPVDLRPLAPADHPPLRDLAVRCWWATYRGLLEEEYIESFVGHTYSLEAIGRAAARPDGHFWVAEAPGGALVGFTQVLAVGRVAHLVRLYVAPEVQALGIGSALWRLVHSKLAAIGVGVCTLTVLATNVGAVRFYERQGFERTGSTPGNRFEYRIRIGGDG
ncbi:2-amino-4-hydroxy-6-hydroxymethyldihydropteridine diphosphokinase [Gloeobacter violaceus]|nr:2-amino-4-hydroxy-6-hydroxymethyldihydropteridine diphosphokinase [Gloeobacter violaceus]